MWFAFNLLSLTYWKQHWPTIPLLLLRCDLLSIYYLWHTENNHRQDGYLLLTVVICFQSIIFDILKTTRPSSGESTSMLWFAFNLLSLTYWKQHYFLNGQLVNGCDLLSIYYLWHTENNVCPISTLSAVVVICFQSIIFDILKTTHSGTSSAIITLWFAFNLLSLTYWKQPIVHYDNLPHVVICFQSIIFDILKTTRQRYGLYRHLLWFAFNLLSLTYWKQRKPVN